MEEEWNWKALTNWSNTRQGSNFQEHQLKRLDRDDLINELIRVACSDRKSGSERGCCDARG